MSTKKSSSESTPDVRIGISDSPQELTFQTSLDVAAVQALVEDALGKNQVLALTDSKGRQVIVASRSIALGEILSEDNLTTKRAGNGLSPMRWNEVVGRQASKPFTVDELITL